MNDLVSIIMSTYNTDKEYLDYSIKSILNQTYNNIEFIIICDGSKEEYDYIKNNYFDKRIRLILHDRNKGLAYSLNEGIKISKGKYIARMDSDDYSFPKRIAIQKKYMDTHPNIDISGMYAKCFGDNNSKVKYFFKKSKEIEIEMLFIPVLIHPTVMFNANFFKKGLFYNESFECAQDKELWTRSVNSNNIGIVAKYGLKYRIHNKQAGIAKRDKQIYYSSLIRRNAIKKIEGISEKDAYELLEILNGVKELTNKNIIKVCQLSKKAIDSTTIFEKKIMRKVIYNRIYILIVKRRLLSYFYKKEVFNVIFNITNLRYTIWKASNNILK